MQELAKLEAKLCTGCLSCKANLQSPHVPSVATDNNQIREGKQNEGLLFIENTDDSMID